MCVAWNVFKEQSRLDVRFTRAQLQSQVIIKSWIETQEWQINKYGVPDGSSMTGIFLNSPGANVFTVGLSLLKSNTVERCNNRWITESRTRSAAIALWREFDVACI